MKSLDTNIILRLILQVNKPHLTKIINLLESSKTDSLHVADVVFFECVWVLAGDYYKFDRELVGKALLEICNVPQINCYRSLIEQAVPIYVSTASVSFTDVCLAVYSKLNDARPLLTFDKKLSVAMPADVILL